MEPILERLLSQAYLFDDPGAYEAGVRDAADAFARDSDDGANAAARLAAQMREHPSSGSRKLRTIDPPAA